MAKNRIDANCFNTAIKCIFSGSIGLIQSTMYTMTIWVISSIIAGWFIWYKLEQYLNFCQNTIGNGLFLTGKLFFTKEGENKTLSASVIGNCSYGSTEFDVLLILLFLVIFGSFGFLCIFLVLWVKFGRKDYLKHKKQTKEIHLSSVVVETDNKTKIKSLNDSSFTNELNENISVPCKSLKEYVCKLVGETWNYDSRLGRDASKLSHKRIVVTSVLKVNNENLWTKYKQVLNNTPVCNLPEELINHPIQTNSVQSAPQENSECVSLLKVNNLGENEVYLFHGTKLEYVQNIIENGFDFTRANEGLYGKGIYFAESSEKADQYTDYKNNRRKSDLAMLVTRVILGRVLWNEKEKAVKAPITFLTGKPKYDTVVAGIHKRFREFLVFNEVHCYPEFIVIYDRED